MPPLPAKPGLFASLAGKLRGAASAATTPLRAQGAAAFAPTVARPSLAPGGEAATRALRTPQASRPTPPPQSRPNPAQQGNAVDRIVPGFLQHDQRLRGIQGKLQARAAKGPLTPQRERLLGNIQEDRRVLHNQLGARVGPNHDIRVEPHLRQGREVALGRGGLSGTDEQELFARMAMPRKGTAGQRASRMMPTLSTSAYNNQAALRGHDPAMRTVAQTVQSARDYHRMIPQAIQPKLGSAKLAFLGSALHRFGNLAQRTPAKALMYTHMADQSLRGALLGSALGAGGGALLARPGDEGTAALQGALLGAATGGGYRAWGAHQDASKAMRSPRELRALKGRLSALQQAGGSLSHVFTA